MLCRNDRGRPLQLGGKPHTFQDACHLNLPPLFFFLNSSGFQEYLLSKENIKLQRNLKIHIL